MNGDLDNNQADQSYKIPILQEVTMHNQKSKHDSKRVSISLSRRNWKAVQKAIQDYVQDLDPAWILWSDNLTDHIQLFLEKNDPTEFPEEPNGHIVLPLNCVDGVKEVIHEETIMEMERSEARAIALSKESRIWGEAFSELVRAYCDRRGQTQDKLEVHITQDFDANSTILRRIHEINNMTVRQNRTIRSEGNQKPRRSSKRRILSNTKENSEKVKPKKREKPRSDPDIFGGLYGGRFVPPGMPDEIVDDFRNDEW